MKRRRKLAVGALVSALFTPGKLSSQTLEATKQPGLIFIGEVVDVTGWLGGYNFQWAWASAHACAQALAAHADHAIMPG